MYSKPDYDIIVAEFINTYYEQISKNGWMTVLNLFDACSVVNYNNINIGTEYDLVCKLACLSIKQANVENCQYSYHKLQNDDILINVNGLMTFTNFTGSISNQKVQFYDIFILSAENNLKFPFSQNKRYKCIYHSFIHN